LRAGQEAYAGWHNHSPVIRGTSSVLSVMATLLAPLFVEPRTSIVTTIIDASMAGFASMTTIQTPINLFDVVVWMVMMGSIVKSGSLLYK
jgi:hypothetical protein